MTLTEDDGTKMVLVIGEVDYEKERARLPKTLTPCEVRSVMKFGYIDPSYIATLDCQP